LDHRLLLDGATRAARQRKSLQDRDVHVVLAGDSWTLQVRRTRSKAMMFHVDKHGIVHEVIGIQDWTMEYYKKCEPWTMQGAKLHNIKQDVIEGRDDLQVTCLRCARM
jgi:hypothetical protein